MASDTGSAKPPEPPITDRQDLKRGARGMRASRVSQKGGTDSGIGG